MKRVYCALITAALCACLAPTWAENAAPSTQTGPQGGAQTTAPAQSQPAAQPQVQPAPQTGTQSGAPAQVTPGVLTNEQSRTQVANPAESLKPINLDEALEIAFQNNPGLRIATDQVNRSKGVIEEARANFMPKFNAQVSQVFQPESTVAFQPNQPPIVIQPSSTTVATLAGTIPIDISRRLSFTTDIARYQFQVDYLGLVRASEQLIFDVKTAYYNVLRARGQQDVAQAAVDAANEVLRNTEARFRAGTVPRFDVTRAQVQVANLTQTLIQAASRVATSRAALNRVMGIDITTPTIVVNSDIKVENVKPDVVQEIEHAYAARPDVQVAQTLADLNAKNIKLQRTGYLPTLNVTGAFIHNFQVSGLNTNADNWNVGMQLNVPIWDGGVTRARINQAKADEARAVDTVEQTKLGVATEVEVAVNNLLEAMDRVASTAQNVALAEESLRLANVRYNAGIATLVEVTDAQSALTQAQFNLVQAQFDYATFLADLQRASSEQPEIKKVQIINPAILQHT